MSMEGLRVNRRSRRSSLSYSRKKVLQSSPVLKSLTIRRQATLCEPPTLLIRKSKPSKSPSGHTGVKYTEPRLGDVSLAWDARDMATNGLTRQNLPTRLMIVSFILTVTVYGGVSTL